MPEDNNNDSSSPKRKNGTWVFQSNVNEISDYDSGYDDYDKKDNFFLLSDMPLDFKTIDANEAFFHLKPIGDNLIRIAKEAESPFTLGIYGNWGRGKTTLIDYMIHELNSDNEYTFKFSK